MPGTQAELVKRSGYAHATVKRWLAKLREGEPEQRAAHIAKWRIPKGRGPASAVWRAGPGEHAPYPTWHTSNAERWRRAKARHGLDVLNAKWVNQYHARRRRAGHVDPLLAPFLYKPCQNETT
jgi:hypothetical protein